MKTFSSIIKRAKDFANYLGKPEDKALIKWYVEKALISKVKETTIESKSANAGMTTPELEVWWKKDGHFNMDLYKRICDIKRVSLC